MATVAVLGGYGVIGSATAALRVGRKDVERVVVAGGSRVHVGRSLRGAHAL